MSEGRRERFLVIVPTYNEKENLPRKIPKILEQDERIDVLVVDDASPDGTGRLADEIATQDPRVHVMHRPLKDGLGKAYLAGFAWALERQYELIFEMDADISHPPEALPSLIAAAEEHDFVIGSRYVDGKVTVSNWPMSRLLVSYFGSWYARTITRMPIRDATGGFNCWHRRVLERVRLSFTEVPILFTERDSGESKMSKRLVREAVWRVWWLKFQQIFRRL